MPLEIEAKFKVDSHEALRARLIELGAEHIRHVHEENYIFDNAEGTLLSSGSGLRVRSCKKLDGDSIYTSVTFKGPLHDNDLKIREELRVRTDDPENTCRIFKALGYAEFLYFEKRRESWRLGECLIELDEVPHIGNHVEIEGPNEEHVRQTQELLGLADLPAINKSYICLLIKHCKEQGIPATRITFDHNA